MLKPVVLSIALSMIVSIVNAQSTSRQPPAEPWQTDYNAFVAALQNCRALNCPIATFADVEVAWQGRLVSWDAKDKVARLDMSDRAAPLASANPLSGVVCCALTLNPTPPAAVPEIGAELRFQATLSSWMPIFADAGRMFVSLDNARALAREDPLELRGRTWASGRVVDGQGVAASGAKVQVSFENLPAFATATRSGDDGTFKLRLPLGADAMPALTLTAMLDSQSDAGSGIKSYAVAGSIDVTGTTTLTLKPGGIVEVLVKDAKGKNVRDTEVSAVTVDGHVVKSIGFGRTAGTGQAVLSVPAGRVTIGASHYKDRRIDAVGETTVDVESNGKHKVTVTVSSVATKR